MGNHQEVWEVGMQGVEGPGWGSDQYLRWEPAGALRQTLTPEAGAPKPVVTQIPPLKAQD